MATSTSTTIPDKQWDPKKLPSRPAETTADIHRTIAWIYGVVGALIGLLAVSLGHFDATLLVAAIFGLPTLLHAVLSLGARRRNGTAKAGSLIVGLLMLLGFPIGTFFGVMLIKNAIEPWPPRQDPSTAPAGGVDMRDL